MGHRGRGRKSTKDWSPKEPKRVEHDVPTELLEEFLGSYIETALWASMDESDRETGGSPMDDNYGPDDLASETLSEMRADALDFMQESMEDIWENISQAGHDFWLTRNGAGVGFWEKGDWPEEAGKRLTETSEAFGEFRLYVGDDRKIYGEEG